ncbi:MAG: surface antigen BspA-like [Anaerocolumna sp.]|jgi:uncharacterized protein YjdB|nr:surface antigen BspA-like [Anaerocolumna sp.]
MNNKIKGVYVILFTAALILLMKGITANAYVGSVFNYTHEGQTITYKVLSEPTETENGTAQIIFNVEIVKNLSGNVIIPATVTNQKMTYNVVGIGNNAFIEGNKITNITLPGTIRFIGEAAFYNCSNLTSINIPFGVTRIESNTFSGCNSLKSISLPAGITYIGNNAFYENKSLSTINLPVGITYIGNNAFYNNCSLTTIHLPDGVSYIGNSAFYNCSKLTAINLPKGILYIGTSAFEGCSGLTSIIIPEGITSIDDMLFKDCTSLATVSLPEGITRIGKNAFYNCSSLVNINLPDDITSIGEYAFYSCKSLISIKIPYGVTKIEDFTFMGNSSLTSIKIQDKITSIGNFAFFGCSNLITISLPEGLTSIGNWAFYECESLRPIKIPSTVTSIGGGDFPYTGVFVYKNSFAETFFKNNFPKHYQIVNLPLEDMSFTETVMNIGVNETINLKPTFYPVFSSEITDNIKWTSSDESVVIVDLSGNVKGIKAGEADITAVMGKYSATMHVIVDGVIVNPTSIAFTNSNIQVNKGDSVKLEPNFTPTNTTNRKINWTSSNNSVVTVENGRIYAKTSGTATITAVSGTITVSCNVTVLNPLKEIFSDYDVISLIKGESKKVAVSYNPMDTTDDKTTIWISENDSIAKVENGVIKAMNPGTTVITAIAGSYKTSIPVTVRIPVKSLTLTQEEIFLKVGQTEQLPIVMQPIDTSDAVIVTSSDESVANYSNGNITALKRGKTTIRVLVGSFSVSFDVTVETDIESISLNKTSLNLYLGKSETLAVTFNPTVVYDSKTVTWVSSDKSVVTVDSKGKIKTVGVGTATIIATAGGNKISKSTVVVKLAVPSIKIASVWHDNVKVSWSAVSGASGYRIYRADSKTGTFKLIKETTALSYTNKGLTTGKTYYYKVRAYRVQGNKKIYGSYTKVIGGVPLPGTPTNVKLVKPKSGTINFTWNKVSGASGYEIYRTSSTKEPFKLTKNTTSLHFINYGLTKGKTYYYKVRTYKIVGNKKYYSKFSTTFKIKM